jgi:hypothetical protein
MTTEDRLRDALRAADAYQPSPDLWARVEGSIEEDRRHRRRVLRVLGAILLAIAVAAAIAFAARVPTSDGTAVDWRAMAAIEVLLLLALIVGLGPALRRFGRMFVADVFRASPETGRAFLVLLDVAFYLVTAGYVLVSVSLDQPNAGELGVLAAQLSAAAARIGGLLLVMGVLHVATLLALPLLGIAFTSGWYRPAGRERHPVPVAVLIVAVAAIAAVLVVVGFVLVGLGGS